MDIIFLQEVKSTNPSRRAGVERATPQTVILDIEVAMPHSRSCQTDAIADTPGLRDIVARIRRTLSEKSFHLVEALAEHVCQLILTEFARALGKSKSRQARCIAGLKALGVVIERTKT